MVEFALVAVIFFTLLLGIMEFGRWLFTLNAASEATRWAARLVVVCGSSETLIQQKVAAMLRSGNGHLEITYSSPACDTADCMVTVKLVDATFTPLIPFLGGSYAIPPFTTTLPREYMKSTGNNTVCP